MDKDLREFLKNIKFRDVEDVYRTQQIIDRLTLPDNLDDLSAKLQDVFKLKSEECGQGWHAVAAYVAPHLATGLKPGDECRVKNELSVCWTTENCWSTEKLLFVGIRKDGRFVVEIEGGLTTSWPICEPIPKKKIYLKRLSEIIRMAESEECGCFHHNELIYLGNIIPWDDLIKWCGKSFTERPYIGPIIAPDAWLEER
jgi:hypothetical protein